MLDWGKWKKLYNALTIIAILQIIQTALITAFIIYLVIK